MRPSAFLYLYARRVRKHAGQELLAGIGIAVGVALVFAVLVASASIAGSASQVIRGIIGTADLQLVSRSGGGFEEGLVARVRRLDGVEKAAAVLEQRGMISGPRGRVPINLVSVDYDLAALSGALTSSFAPGALQLRRGVILPSNVASALGVPSLAAQAVRRPRPKIELELRGRRVPVQVAAVLGPETLGPLAQARVALAPLPYVQRIAGRRARVTRIFVEASAGAETKVRDGLADLAGGRITVASADAEADLLEQAVRPNDQATAFFAAISAIIGLLLAFNAMLLTAPERRREVADLRIVGFRPWQLVKMVMFQALVLGIAASVLGLFLGNLLARTVFHETPDYLASVFALGTQTVVTAKPVAVSFIGGVVATCLAAAPPLLDLRRNRAVDAIYHAHGGPGQSVSPGVARVLCAGAGALVVVATVLVVVEPSAALVGTIAVGFAAALAIPSVFAAVRRTAEFAAARTPRLRLLIVALFGLRATTLRSLALAATGAIAVFGAIAIGGARRDLLEGLERAYWGYVNTTDLWVVNRNDDLTTKDFRPGELTDKVAAVSGVAAVRRYHGAFLDFSGRRVLVVGRPRGDPNVVPPTEMLTGDATASSARIRRGGWVTVSGQIASEQSREVGDTLTLPTPTGNLRYRIAATTTNLGWIPGAVIMNSADFRDAWGTTDPTGLEVDLRPGADPVLVKGAITDALGPASALTVQTVRERADQANALARQGLRRLGQISSLLLAAAGLAIAGAMAASLWQRRAGLATLRLQGFRPSQLWRIVMIEASLVLGAGCLAGALAGIYGEALMDRYLRLTTGFPAPFSPTGWETLEACVVALAVALVAVAIPARLASRVPARLGLQD